MAILVAEKKLYFLLTDALQRAAYGRKELNLDKLALEIIQECKNRP